jgi:hypothetical protein
VAFALTVAGYIDCGIGLGWFYARGLRRRGRIPSLMSDCLCGAAIWDVIMTLGMPLLGAGIFGTAPHPAMGGTMELRNCGRLSTMGALMVKLGTMVESTDPVTGEGGNRWRLVHNCRR